ncbi:hypothetical protein ACHAW6_007556 [Cyclotella cf. meneghiniana]
MQTISTANNHRYLVQMLRLQVKKCTIINPIWIYKNLRLPTGLNCSPDIAQCLHFNDVGAFSHTWDNHVKLLGNTLHHLNETALLLTHLNVNGLSEKLTGWAIGSLHVA